MGLTSNKRSGVVMLMQEFKELLETAERLRKEVA